MIGRVLLPVGHERLEKFIEPEPNSGCWLWTGSTDSNGYGQARQRARTLRTHRAVYELLKGPIPAGLTLDHLCRVRRCVNPAHLEPVTNRENILRGVGPNRTHCPQGHPYDDHNTFRYTYRGSTRRNCRACTRARTRALELRKYLAAETRPCLCGCGTPVPSVNKQGQPRLGWVSGHNRRVQASG